MLELKLFDASPAWTIEDDTLVGYDLSFTRGLAVGGLDPVCDTDDSLTALSAQVSELLSGLPEDATIRFVSVELAGYDDYLADYVARFAASPRGSHLAAAKVKQCRESFRVRERELYCFVSTPAVLPASQFEARILNRRAGKLLERARALHTEKVREATRLQRLVQRALSTAKVPSRELDGQALFGIIWRLANPTRSRSLWPPEHNPKAALRPQLFASGVYNHYDHFEREGQLNRVLTLKTPPKNIIPSQILELQTLPFRHALTVTLRRVADETALRRVDSNRRQGHELNRLLAKFRGAERHAELPDHALLQQQNEVNDVLARLTRGEKLFDVAVQLSFSATDRETLERRTQAAFARFRACGQAEAGVEEMRGRFAFLSTLPGHHALIGDRWHSFLATRAADLVPLFAANRGSQKPVALLATRHNELVGFEPFDPSLMAWSATVAGTTGSGKSFAVRSLLLGWLAQGGRVVIATRGRDYHRYAEIFGGSVYDVSLDDPALALGPFPPPSTAASGEFLQHLTSILAVMVQEVGRTGERLERRLLYKATAAVYHDRADAQGAPTFREWLEALMRIGQEEPDTRLFAERIVRQMLFWLDGPYGMAFCRNRPPVKSEQLSVWNLEKIKDADTQGVVLAVLSGVIAQSIQAGPTIVVLDEVWSLFKSEAGTELVEGLYRTVRKEGSSIWTISQSINDYLQLPEATRSAVLNNSHIKLFLPHDASERDLVATTFKLTPHENDLLGSLTAEPGRFSELLAFFGNRRQVLRLEPTALEYWLSTSHAKDRDYELAAIEQNPGLNRWELLQRLARSYPHGVVNLSSAA